MRIRKTEKYDLGMPKFIDGIKKSPTDKRDFKSTLVKTTVLPESVSLRKYCPRVKNQGSIGSCFPSSTLVLTGDISYKPISELRVGETVITHTGNRQRIYKTMKRIWQGNVFDIHTYGFYKGIEATPEHPFMTQRGWVPAKDLTKNDYLLISSPKIIKDCTITPLEDDLDFLWLLGLYIAEGSIVEIGNSTRVTFSLDLKRDDLFQKIKYIANKYGVDVHESIKNDCKCRNARFSDKYLSSHLLELGGKLCDKKKIHKRLMLISPEKQMHIFNGWYDGDGNDKLYKFRKTGKTTSKILAQQLQLILHRNNIFGTICKCKERDDRKPAYSVNYNVKQSETFRMFKTNQGIFTKITKINKKQFTGGYVYNLSIENDETYIVEGRVVHNCGSNAFASAYETIMNIKGSQLNVELSELFHYYVVRSKDFMDSAPSDSGQFLRDGCKVLQKVGISPEVFCPYITSNYNNQPNSFAYGFARWWKIKSYKRCYSIEDIKGEIANNNPVVFGMIVYDSFLSWRKEEYTLSDVNGRKAGGHAMALVSYDNKRNAFLVLNSWGDNWGRFGYCWVSYDVIKKFLIEAWSIEL